MQATILELIKKSSAFLEKKGVPDPRLSTERLFAHVLGCKRLDLYLKFEQLVSANEVEVLREVIQRRAHREPWQYIVNEVEFGPIRLDCDKRALIPRHETEELLEQLSALLKDTPPKAILDLGTGTGALALGLAVIFPHARVIGVDASVQALELAKHNAEKNKLAHRVDWLFSNWLESLDSKMRFDLIVSNPPYLTEEEWLTAEPEVKNFEPKSALVAANDGIADLLHILEIAPQWLNSGGWLALETGILHPPLLAEKAKMLGYLKTLTREDFSRRPRFFLGKK
jgi:release factor glutamine methyltransferase